MTELPKPGDLVRVWWRAPDGRKTPDGAWNLARVLEVHPYTGAFPDYYGCILYVAADTPEGSIPMAWPHDEGPYREKQP